MKGGQVVREARRRAGLSQADLAARVGTTQSAIARLEASRTAPSLERVTELVRACGFDLRLGLVSYDDHDWTIAEQNLPLTPDQRLQRMIAGVRFAEAAQQAMKEARGG